MSLENVHNWYDSLQPRERMMVVATAVIVLVTLFYLMLWEPLYKGLDNAEKQYSEQQTTLSWMQQAAQEVKILRNAGASSTRRNASSPVSLTLEQTASSAGLKNQLGKLESSDTNAARARLDNVAFNQMILWLNTLEQTYGITANSASIERTDKPGIVNARLSFSRNP